MKLCTKCQTQKPVDQFWHSASTPDGRQGWCKSCASIGARALREKNLRIVREAKDVPCADCGKTYPPYVMDFDHLPGAGKSFEIGRRNTRDYTTERLLQEMAKCEVVCSNCHRERTWGHRENVAMVSGD